MIYEKSIDFPKTVTRKLRYRGCSLFREREGMLTAESSFHFRPEGDFLVCGEGRELVKENFRCSFLRGDKHGLIYYDNGTSYRFRDGKSILLGHSMKNPYDTASYYSKEEEDKSYAVAENGIFSVDRDTFNRVSEISGVCCAVHAERLFTAKGCRVYYSRALAPWDWRESLQSAGFLDLPSESGDIVAMVPYKEKLYLFRERGITQLRALGDNLNFKAVAMPYSCGKIFPHSVVNCGEKILFLTDGGLYAFNGGICSRLKGSGAHLWKPCENPNAVHYGIRYYACVRTDRGEPGVLSYDCEEETGYLIRAKAETLAVCGESVYFTEEGKLFRMTDRGFSEEERAECVLKTELSAFGLFGGTKYLDGITLGGKGYFRVRAENERGEGCCVYGKAGENLRFPCPVRGNAFSLRISAYTEGVRLGEIAIVLREEG